MSLSHIFNFFQNHVWQAARGGMVKLLIKELKL